MDFGRRAFAQHGENEFKIVHMIAQVFALQTFELLVLAGGDAKCGF